MLRSRLGGGTHSVDECVLGESDVPAGRLGAGVSEDGADGEEIVGACVHGGPAPVTEGVSSPFAGQCSSEALGDVPGGEVPTVLPREKVTARGAEQPTQVGAHDRYIPSLPALAGDVEAGPVPVA